MNSIRFSQASKTAGLDTIEGDWWLYEEFHLSDLAVFELHVLCEESEFVIAADDIRVESGA